MKNIPKPLTPELRIIHYHAVIVKKIGKIHLLPHTKDATINAWEQFDDPRYALLAYKQVLLEKYGIKPIPDRNQQKGMLFRKDTKDIRSIKTMDLLEELARRGGGTIMGYAVEQVADYYEDV
jgi:hypothetical protein